MQMKSINFSKKMFPILLLLFTGCMSFSAIAIDSAASSSFMAEDNSLPRKDNAPFETIAGVETKYGSVRLSNGVHVRTLVSRPMDADGVLKPLLFTQWVSCGTIEYREGSGAREILAALARNSGMALVRIERAGTGDSEGPACNELGYDLEVEHYIEAFSRILESDELDASQVFLYGASLGSTTAPLVAEALQNRGFEIAGIAVQGGGALTHFERMLNFERIYLERRPESVPRDRISSEIANRAIFHAEYLLKHRRPDSIAADSTDMAQIRDDILGLSESDHYGRPFSWHQEAANRDFLGAWAKLTADVLVIFNEYDQFEMRHGHSLIVDTVNYLRPGTATFIEQSEMGHNHFRFDSLNAAYANENGVPAWERTAQVLSEWFSSLVAQAN